MSMHLSSPTTSTSSPSVPPKPTRYDVPTRFDTCKPGDSTCVRKWRFPQSTTCASLVDEMQATISKVADGYPITARRGTIQLDASIWQKCRPRPFVDQIIKLNAVERKAGVLHPLHAHLDFRPGLRSGSAKSDSGSVRWRTDSLYPMYNEGPAWDEEWQLDE